MRQNTELLQNHKPRRESFELQLGNSRQEGWHSELDLQANTALHCVCSHISDPGLALTHEILAQYCKCLKKNKAIYFHTDDFVMWAHGTAVEKPNSKLPIK